MGRAPLLFIPSSVPHLPDLLKHAGMTARWTDDHRDKVAYVLHLIVTLPHFQRCASGYVDLSQRHLARTLGTRYVKPVLDILLNQGIIESDMRVYRGVKALGYRITPAYQSAAIGIDVFKTETFLATLSRTRLAACTDHPRGSLLANVELDLRKLRIQFEAAQLYSSSQLESALGFIRQHADTLNTSTLRSAAYQQIHDLAAITGIRLMPLRDVRTALRAHRKHEEAETSITQVLIRNATDRHNCNLFAMMQLHQREIPAPTRPVLGSRVYTILTNLSAEMRQFLFHARHDNVGLCNIDIRNSQPFFLSLLLQARFLTQPRPADVDHYIMLTSGGTFYEHTAAGMGQRLPEKLPTDTPLVQAQKARARAEFKTTFFSSLFFCRNTHTQNSRAGRYFQEQFPAVAAFLQEQKREAYERLAIDLQHAEAQVMVEKVSKRLHRERIWHAGLHDSIICLPQHADQVAQLIQGIFQRCYALAPTLTIERLPVS